MNEPIIEQIAIKLVERVGRVKKAAGYFYDLTAERLKAVNAPVPFKAVVYQDQTDDREGNLNECAWTEHFAIAVFILPGETDPTPVDQYRNRLCACLNKAVLTDKDGNFDPQLDGLADRVDIRAPMPFQVVKIGPEGVTFNLSVNYRHSLTDPGTK